MFCKVFILVAFLAINVRGKAWDRSNNPNLFSSSFVYNLAQLPLQTKVPTTPWSDTYWPSFQGGIANRWQDKDNNYPGFNYQLYSLDDLKNGAVDLNILSPAEKYDIYISRYDYPLTNSEWQRVKPDDPEWEGLCHGWSPAAYNYKQPNPVTLTNQDGLSIPFGSSDVKALLIYFLAQYAQDQEKTNFCANRCNTDIKADPSKATLPECWDINPGSFHVIIANMIQSGRAFVGDIDRSIEVWNQPISGVSFVLGSTRNPSNGSAPQTKVEQQVTATMSYTKETEPMVTAHQPLTYTAKYTYWLELDASKNIVGGNWDSKDYDRTDFLWNEAAPAFYGFFSGLSTIYARAIQPTVELEERPQANSMIAHAKRVTGSVTMRGYDDSTSLQWIVTPATSGNAVRVHFESLNIRREVDSVKIFEVSEDGVVGALVGVFYGRLPSKDIVVKGKSVLVTFGVDMRAGRRSKIDKRGEGFSLTVQSA